MEGINKPSLLQPYRAEKVIRVNNVWAVKGCFDISSGLVPEALGLCKARVAVPTPEVGTAYVTGRNGPVWIPEEIPECRLQNVRVLGIQLGQRPDETVRNVSTPGFQPSGLADVKGNLHRLQASRNTLRALPPIQRVVVWSIWREIAPFHRNAA